MQNLISKNICSRKVCIIINIICIVLGMFFSCKQTHEIQSKDILEPEKEEDFFSLLDSNGIIYKPFLIYENTIHILINPKTDFTRLLPKFQKDIEILFLDDELYYGSEINFSDFVTTHEFKILFNEKIEAYKIILYDIPVLMIETPNAIEITSKEERVENCKVVLIDDNNSMVQLGKAGIKGRGNSTWLQPKKPYNIKFDKKQEILGMNKSKHWILLANAYYDRTQLHDAVAFEIARKTDYAWVQSGRFVEVILNNKHKGLYYLCEKIDVEKNKINIDKLKSDDLEDDKIKGGYLLEVDNIKLNAELTQENSFITKYFNRTTETSALPIKAQLFWFLKDPEDDVPKIQLQYIENALNNMESLLSDEKSLLNGEYRNYLDIESVINWWFVEELCQNEEAARTKNLYVYKKRDDNKFYFGPPWDLDAWTLGMRGKNVFYAKDSFYYAKLFKDPVFVSRVKEKWELLYPIWKEEIPVFIDEQYEIIHRGAERNDNLWNDWHPLWSYPEKNYKQIILEMKEAFLKQLEWMNLEIEQL